MKYSPLFLLSLVFLFLSCQSKTATGVLAGGALGAGIGGIAGGGKGALIGGASGVIAGGLIGAALDEQDRRIMERSSPKTVSRMDRGEPITVDDVIKLHQGGVSDKTIIRYIRHTRTSYTLSQAQIQKLQDAGVSQSVVQYMIDTGR